MNLSLLDPPRAARQLLAAIESMTVAEFDESKHPRDDRGRFGPGSGSTQFVRDEVEGRAILDKAKSQSHDVTNSTQEEQHQQALADAQTNPLAHPPFVLGMDNAIGGEVERYVAAYGQEFQKADRLADVEQGRMKECYRNASMLVMERPDLTYAEGFAKSEKTGDLTFMHAWAVDNNNRVVDPTWTDGHSYFGVKYDRGAYLQQLYKAKFFGVTAAKFKDAQRYIATGAPKLRGVK